MNKYLKIALSVVMFTFTMVVMAQDYYVNGFSGDVMVGRGAQKQKVQVNQKINEAELLTIPKGGKIVLLDCVKNQQYTLSKQGRKSLKAMLDADDYDMYKPTKRFFKLMWDEMRRGINSEDKIRTVVFRGDTIQEDSLHMDKDTIIVKTDSLCRDSLLTSF